MLEAVGSSIFMVQTELQNICKFLPDFISQKMKFLKNQGSV